MKDIIFEMVAIGILALTMVTWPLFGRISMRQIEKAIMAEGWPRPCYWDGAGFRIILYAAAMVMPKLAFNKQDEKPGRINPALVNKHAKTYDRVLAWILMLAIYGVVFITIVSMALGIP